MLKRCWSGGVFRVNYHSLLTSYNRLPPTDILDNQWSTFGCNWSPTRIDFPLPALRQHTLDSIRLDSLLRNFTCPKACNYCKVIRKIGWTTPFYAEWIFRVREEENLVCVEVIPVVPKHTSGRLINADTGLNLDWEWEREGVSIVGERSQ